MTAATLSIEEVGALSARVYLTNLFNLALPLIRFEITDQVTALEDPCPCGSAQQRISDVEGRLARERSMLEEADAVVVVSSALEAYVGRSSPTSGRSDTRCSGSLPM